MPGYLRGGGDGEQGAKQSVAGEGQPGLLVARGAGAGRP